MRRVIIKNLLRTIKYRKDDYKRDIKSIFEGFRGFTVFEGVKRVGFRG